MGARHDGARLVGQHGKDTITVSQLLAHRAGLFAFDEPVEPGQLADLDQLAIVLARRKPAWAPGERQAYHALSLGFYEGELLRRVDPRHRSLGQFFQEEIATPLGEDVFIGLPSGIRMPGSRHWRRHRRWPCFARGIAHAYGVFASDGRELGLRPVTLQLLAEPAAPPASGAFNDEFFRGHVEFSLGFMKPGGVWLFGGTRMGTSLTGDPRDIALRNALYASLRHA